MEIDSESSIRVASAVRWQPNVKQLCSFGAPANPGGEPPRKPRVTRGSVPARTAIHAAVLGALGNRRGQHTVLRLYTIVRR